MLFSKRLRLSLAQAEQILADAKKEEAFWTHNGIVIHNLHELERFLSNTTDALYAYHVNDDKNDFSVWVRDAIKDEILARQLKAARNRPRTAALIRKRVRALEHVIDGEREKIHALENDVFQRKKMIQEISLVAFVLLVFCIAIYFLYYFS